ATVISALVLGVSHTFCATAPPSPAARPTPPLDASRASDAGTGPPLVSAADAGDDPFATPTPATHTRWTAIAEGGRAALLEGKLPGCVVVIGRRAEVLFRRAYGLKSVEPARAPMPLDTVFDLASLTKAVATTSSVMVLVDHGQVDLDEPV